MSAKTDWPAKALRCLKVSSRVDLEGEHIDDLSRLGQPKMMRTFNLSYCQISTIEGLKQLPHLEAFIADGSQLISLKNFSAISNIRKLSLIQTPVSMDPQFVLSVLLACPNLTSLNGRQIPGSVRQRAQNYPLLGVQLVDSGWLADWPAPDDERITELCVEYNVPIETDEEKGESEASGDEIDRFDEVIIGYYSEHKRLVRAAKKMAEIELEDEEEDDAEEEEEMVEEESQASSNGTETKMDDFDGDDHEQTLVEKLAEILRENEVEIDENDMYNSVLAAIDTLCEEKDEKKMAELMQESDGSQD